ncbi:MAG TPA: methyltransferase [Methanothrix sp.]|nr:methyltransferase [Methanothrix sp.]
MGRDMICPVCKGDCLRAAEEVIADVETRYLSCRRCPPEPNLSKNISGRLLPARVERCSFCGRAALDAVMLDALRLLQSCRLRDEDDGLRSVGMPLIDVGYPLAYPPRLGRNSLILVGEKYSKAAAEAMVRDIPEIKGVIESRGVPGVMNPKEKPLENLLLAGCDLRADVVSSLMGELVVYKRQSLIHIEFSRQNSPKMRILEELYFRGKLRDVADGLCGPGTLGLMCVLAGAERVVFNDAWLPAVEDLLMNLEVNRKMLGIEEIEHMETPTRMVGRKPVLVARTRGACRIEVYHGDLARLFSRARPAELCLIDHFPGSDTRALEQACRSCKETVIV